MKNKCFFCRQLVVYYTGKHLRTTSFYRLSNKKLITNYKLTKVASGLSQPRSSNKIVSCMTKLRNSIPKVNWGKQIAFMLSKVYFSTINKYDLTPLNHWNFYCLWITIRVAAFMLFLSTKIMFFYTSPVLT